MKITDYLARDELAMLTRRSDMLAWWAFAVNWGLIAGAFAIAIALEQASFGIHGRRGSFRPPSLALSRCSSATRERIPRLER